MRHLLNPQDLNRYAYVANNPLRFIDPDGQEKIQVVFQAYIPDKSATVETQGTHQGDDRPVPEAGDQAGSGSFRIMQVVTIETDPTQNGGSPIYGKIEKDTGITYQSDKEGNPIGKPLQASGDSLQGEVTRKDDGAVNIHIHGNESIPDNSKAPGIKYNLDIGVKQGKDGKVEVSVSGNHRPFPAYEVDAARTEKPGAKSTVVYSYDPNKANRGPWSLVPGLAVGDHVKT